MMQSFINPLVLALALGGSCASCAAELSQGSGLSAESAVMVLSAESEADLYDSVSAWVKQRYPQDAITTREFQYVANDRALLILRTLTSDGGRRAVFFETSGLPFQFVRKKP